jgi:hypothetical protein
LFSRAARSALDLPRHLVALPLIQLALVPIQRRELGVGRRVVVHDRRVEPRDVILAARLERAITPQLSERLQSCRHRGPPLLKLPTWERFAKLRRGA